MFQRAMKEVYYTPVEKKPRLAPKPYTCPEMPLKEPVSVFCRIRPPEDDNEDAFTTPVDSRTVKLTPPVTSFAFRNGSAKEQLFRFKHVFASDASQKEVFDHVAKPLIGDLLNGKNGLLFVYGITGSGKTYTMEGTRSDGGILRRTIDVIFNSINKLQSMKYVFKPDRMNGFEIQSEADAMLDRQRIDVMKSNRRYARYRKEVSGSQDSYERIPDSSHIGNVDEDNVYGVFVNYLEIYNNYIYDLLEEFSENNMVKDLQSKILREDSKRNMYVHGCTEVEVLAKGQKRRKVAHTRLNCESSRSHSIFNVRIVQAPHDAQGEAIVMDKAAIITSQFSMVDLAGSERNNRTKATGERIKEAGNINNSLMALRQCIECLRENQLNRGTRKVPYRESKLTHYFKNYFEGEGKVNMIVCVNPKLENYDETLPVMKFAELASEVQVHRPASSVRPDLGFTPEIVDITPVYSLAPSWPTMEYTSESSFEEMVENLKIYLQKRLATKEKFNSELSEQRINVRERIMEMEKENVYLRQESGSLRSLYDDAMKKVKHYESLLLNAEADNDSLQRKLTEYITIVDDYNQACEERDMAKSQGQLEKQRMKARLKAKLEAEREKLAREMRTKLKEQKGQLKSQMYVTQVKALQAMFDNPQTPAVKDNSKGSHSVKRSLSDPKVNEPTNNAMDSESPPARIATRQQHRRSLSQGANVGPVWIDHRPDQVVEPGTLLQPNMPRRRSVRLLKSEDIESKKASHYCLTTQGEDSSGEIATKMYKGNILPTVGGGAQVVFQDVEILKQKDPLDVCAVKRGCDGAPKVDLQTLQNRCAVGLTSVSASQATSYAKKMRK
ncbi:Kinesin-like protein KIF23 [Armadillidium nasatum]|uniref:Kinesin-like protein n=1 Tax=Armadillidium nasatum TaxID=96803 RepID=A0A5N5T4I1_9CRUS|nr:Kinesin-like protein KIF23 [Armadillidium nasatum]